MWLVISMVSYIFMSRDMNLQNFNMGSHLMR